MKKNIFIFIILVTLLSCSTTNKQNGKKTVDTDNTSLKMKYITNNIYQFNGLDDGQSYLLIDKNGLVLIDTGFSSDFKKISSQIEEAGYKINNVNTIILTHCHFDHTANVKKIQELSNAQIISHKLEKPYIERKAKIHYNSFFKGIFWSVINKFFNVKGILVDKTVEEGDILDILGGLQVIHTPGHTPGSMALYALNEKILFSGDCLHNEKKFEILGGGVFNTDDQELKNSAKKFLKLDINKICVGHGEPILEEANMKLLKL